MARLISAALLLLMLTLTGCAALDSITGADDPEVIAGTKPSVVENVAEGAEAALPYPWSIIAGGVLGWGAKAYRDVRAKQKEAEGAAA